MDRPVDRNLGPDHKAHLLGQTHHILVVWIVGQTYEIATHLLGPSEKRRRVFLAPCATAVIGALLMDADSAAEYLLVVEQKLGAFGSDRPEADSVGQCVVAGDQADVIKFRVCRAPALRLRLERELHPSVGAESLAARNLQFRNLNQHALRRGTVGLDEPGEGILLSRRKLQRIIADESLRSLDERHRACDSAVVPPVGVDGRNALRAALVVHLHDERILPLAQLARYLEIEGSEPAGVRTQTFAVEPDDSLVIGRTEMEKLAFRWVEIGSETLAIPDGALIIVQFRALGVPVAGDIDALVRLEVIFLKTRRIVIILILRIKEIGRIEAVIIISVFERIDNRAPFSVERDGVARRKIGNQRFRHNGRSGQSAKSQGRGQEGVFHDSNIRGYSTAKIIKNFQRVGGLSRLPISTIELKVLSLRSLRDGSQL